MDEHDEEKEPAILPKVARSAGEPTQPRQAGPVNSAAPIAPALAAGEVVELIMLRKLARELFLRFESGDGPVYEVIIAMRLFLTGTITEQDKTWMTGEHAQRMLVQYFDSVLTEKQAEREAMLARAQAADTPVEFTDSEGNMLRFQRPATQSHGVKIKLDPRDPRKW